MHLAIGCCRPIRDRAGARVRSHGARHRFGACRRLSEPSGKNHRALRRRREADAIPRLVGDWLSRKWGQPVVIENRTGAAGNIGADFVYHSDPDGYTLLSSPPPPLVINQNLYPKLGFDPAKFEPVIVMAQVPNALIVNPKNLKASSVSELIDYLQQNPEKVTAATQGIGTTSHLTAELFQVMAKVKLRTIPYRGSAPAL